MRRDDADSDSSLKRLHRAASMEEAIKLEEHISDVDLGLVAQSANKYGYPTR